MSNTTKILYLIFAYTATLGFLLLAGLALLPVLTGEANSLFPDKTTGILSGYGLAVALLPIGAVLLTHRYLKHKFPSEPAENDTPRTPV